MDEERSLVTEERFPRAWCAKGLDWMRGSGGKEGQARTTPLGKLEGFEGIGLLACFL
jgi:hypothetical protein